MLPTKPSANTTPTALFIAMLTLFVITAVLNTSCNKDQNPRSDAVQQPGASPSPSARPSGTPPIREDTIIVIKGGGSVDLDFDEKVFVSDGSAHPKYVCAKCDYTELEVGPVSGPFGPPCKIANQNSSMHIDAGGGNKDIRIKRNPAHGLVIDFDNTEYILTGTKPHHGAHGHLKKIDVNPSLSCQCPTTGECEIHIRADHP